MVWSFRYLFGDHIHVVIVNLVLVSGVAIFYHDACRRRLVQGQVRRCNGGYQASIRVGGKKRVVLGLDIPFVLFTVLAQATMLLFESSHLVFHFAVVHLHKIARHWAHVHGLIAARGRKARCRLEFDVASDAFVLPACHRTVKVTLCVGRHVFDHFVAVHALAHGVHFFHT